MSMAQEPDITPFKFIGMKGHIGLQYQENESFRGELFDPKIVDRFISTQEEVYLLTRSYVYHPNLLQMDFGLGLTKTQNESEVAGAVEEYDDELTSVSARLRFLNQKPYPFTLFYDRSNPTVGVSSTEKFVQTQEHYGIEASLLEPLLPFSLNINASRQTFQGKGLSQVVDEVNDHFFIRAYQSLGSRGHNQLSYSHNRRQSASGNLALSINETDITSESTSLDTHYYFGENERNSITNLISYFTQDELPDREEVRVNPSVNLYHSDSLSSFYVFNFLDSTVGTNESKDSSGAVGVNYKPNEKITTGLEVQSQKTETTGHKSNSNRGSGTFNYAQPFENGRFSIGAGFNVSKTEQEGTSVQVIGEILRLEGLDQVAISSAYVSTVVVYNETRTQQYQDGVDYQLVTIGYTTYIQRLSTGNIQPGEIVSVDYTYQTSGDVSYSSTGQNLKIGLDLFRFYSLYANYAETEVELESGESLLPLNSVKNTRVGARVNYPFLQNDIRIGGEASYEEQRATVNSYDRDSTDVYIQAAFSPWIRFHVTARQVQQDNYDTENDMDLVQKTASVTTYPWPRASISLQLSNTRDTGGTVLRQVEETSIVARWQIRKLTLSVDGRTIEEQLGTYQRRHKLFTAVLRRTF